MKKYISLLIALASLLAVSCERETVTQQGEVRFQAGIGTLQTKATDTAFEAGDAIGITALYPINAINYKATLSRDGAVTLEQPIYWGVQQSEDDLVWFWACYPYLEGIDPDSEDGFRFAVKEDQSTHEALTASDLMFANIWACPGDGVVPLNFVHQLCQIVLVVDDRIGAEVTGLTLDGIKTEMQIQSAPGSPLGVSIYGFEQSAKTVAACKTEYQGKPAWACIVPPQWLGGPAITLTTKNLGTIEVKSYNGDYMGIGHRLVGTISLTETMNTVVFDKEVHPWLDGDELVFLKPVNQVDATAFHGTWELFDYDGSSDPDDPEIFSSFTFRKDGTYSFVAPDLEEDGTYIYDGEVITLQADWDEYGNKHKVFAPQILQDGNVLVLIKKSVDINDDYSRDVVFEMGYKRDAEISSSTEGFGAEWIWYMERGEVRTPRVYLALYPDDDEFNFIIPVWSQRYTGAHWTYEKGYLTLYFNNYYWLNGEWPADLANLEDEEMDYAMISGNFPWSDYWQNPQWKGDEENGWRWGMSYYDELTFPAVFDGNVGYAFIANLCNYFEKKQ